MHLFLGALFVLAGLGCLRYVWAGAAAFRNEPPFLALGVVLAGIGVGLVFRARTAALLAGVGLVGGLAAVAGRAVRLLAGGDASDHADERLIVQVHLFGWALAAAGIALLFLLVRRARAAPAFGAMDLVPLGGLAAALVLAAVWLVADDARLRPCRNGSVEACGALATALLEAVERAPGAPPTAAEERAAGALAAHRCGADDPGACGLLRYAAGTVAARARRVDAAKEAFLAACDTERSWCARAAQEPVPWTPDERARLTARGR